ncbi:MAG: rhodanese-like domain-containing protein [bacterium]
MFKNVVLSFIICILSGLPFCAWATEPDFKYNGKFDLGIVLINSEVRHTFIISHKGSDILQIKSANSSCDCLHILSYPIEIPLHENGEIEVRLIPSEPGEVECDVVLETDNSPITSLHYQLRGRIEGETLLTVNKQEMLEIPAKIFTRKLRTRDLELAVSVESVLQKLKRKECLILIDIRESGEFKKFRIPGSINIPLFTIKTNIFLKSNPLILVNEGYSYKQLEKECNNLRNLGFKAWILDGGLYNWREKGAPLEGDIFAQRELSKIPAQIFFAEKDYKNWIVIDMTQLKKPEARYLIPQAIHIPYSDDSEQFISRLKTVISPYKDEPFLSLLICDDNGKQYEKIEKIIQKEGINNIFYLKGGIEEYESFLHEQASIWQRRDDPKKAMRSIKKCLRCP